VSCPLSLNNLSAVTDNIWHAECEILPGPRKTQKVPSFERNLRENFVEILTVPASHFNNIYSRCELAATLQNVDKCNELEPLLLKNWFPIFPKFSLYRRRDDPLARASLQENQISRFFLQRNKNYFSPVSKIKFVFHPTQTANLGTLRPGSFVALIKTYTMVKKVSEIFRSFRENKGKRFFFGGNFPLNGGNCRIEKLCRIWEQE